MRNLMMTIGVAAASSACSERVDLGEIEGESNMPNTTLSEPIALVPTIHGMCALEAAGPVSCWFHGDPDGVKRVPAASGHPVRLIGGGSLCTILADGALGCWEPTLVEPMKPVRGVGRVRDIAIGYEGGCVLSEAGEELCWDHLDASVPDVLSPMPLPRPAVQVSNVYTHACAVLDDGRVFCHGRNRHGVVDGQPLEGMADAYHSTPVEFSGIGDAKQVAVAHHTTCVLHQSGTVTCVGAADYAGLGPLETSAGRGQVPGLSGVVAIGADFNFTCALTTEGSLYCWGSDYCGTLANREAATTADAAGRGACGVEYVRTPTLVPGFESVKNFGVGLRVCATDLEDRVWCRGPRHGVPDANGSRGWVPHWGPYRVNVGDRDPCEPPRERVGYQCLGPRPGR
jgi:hypothetical protein